MTSFCVGYLLLQLYRSTFARTGGVYRVGFVFGMFLGFFYISLFAPYSISSLSSMWMTRSMKTISIYGCDIYIRQVFVHYYRSGWCRQKALRPARRRLPVPPPTTHLFFQFPVRETRELITLLLLYLFVFSCYYYHTHTHTHTHIYIYIYIDTRRSLVQK